MNAFKRFLAILLVLALSNLGTYLFARWQCRQELEGQQALLDQASEQTRSVEAKLASAEEELSRLRVWGDFISIQQDLNRVNNEINQLNFGNALAGVDTIVSNLEAGAYGDTFREHRSRLMPILMEAKQALRNRSDAARESLVHFNEAAFTILSGLGSVREEAPAETTAQDAGEGDAMPAEPPAEKPAGPEATPAATDTEGDGGEGGR